MRPLPKIHECLGGDYLRPAMAYVLVKKDETVATDAHTLVVHKSSELFDDEFLNSLPEDGIYLRKDAITDLGRKDIITVIFHEEMKVIEVVHKGKGYVPSVKRFYETLLVSEQETQYPAYNNVWPQDPGEAVEKIGFKPELLIRLSKAMGKNNGLKLTFHGEYKTIIVKPLGGDFPSVKGLIMPIIINE